MPLKRKMNLAAPVIQADGLRSLIAFDINYIYVHPDSLTVHMNPPGTEPICIHLSGSGVSESKGHVALNATQSTKVSNFIQAIEDACKANLELP